MAIGNLQVIDIGLPNEAAGSDSLYDAFYKTKNNFANLFACASPYTSFSDGVGITANTNANTVTITNTGVLSLTAGDSSINLSGSNGNITITATGGGNGGGVSSVGVNSSTLTVNTTAGGNIVSSGNIIVNLPATGVVAAQYTNPTVTVDTYGRVTGISNNVVSGTVTNVTMVPGAGIQISTAGNTNSSPQFTVINTGVTRVSQGSGILLSGSNGNVTISTTPVAAVTSVALTSSSLTVTGSPITGAGTINVELPSNVSVTGSTTIGTFMRLTPGTAPSSPTAGMVYYDSGSNTLKCYNGTSWLTITMA
jgi:hypothetical protein